MAKKVKASNLAELLVQEKKWKTTVSKLHRKQAGYEDYPKMVEFMVIDEDESGLTLISDERELFTAETVDIDSERFSYSKCSPTLDKISAELKKEYVGSIIKENNK